jgi:hypothetical protein
MSTSPIHSLGRGTNRRRGAAAGGLLMALALAGTAVAGTGIGGTFQLGVNNTVDAATTLTTNVMATSLRVINNATTGASAAFYAVNKSPSQATAIVQNTAGSALFLSVPAGQPAVTTSAGSGTATNLSADKLDQLDSTAFLRSTGKAVDADKLDGIDSSGYLKNTLYRRTVAGTGFCPSSAGCFLRVDCLTGDTLISGGYDSVDNGTRIFASRPGKDLGNNNQPTAFGWVVWWQNNSTLDTVEVTVTCMNQ